MIPYIVLFGTLPGFIFESEWYGMSEFLDAIITQIGKTPDRVAFRNTSREKITYKELGSRSDALALYLVERGKSGHPIVLLGHKEPDMIVGMVGSMKVGSPYVPIDASFPPGRVLNIIKQLEAPVILEVREGIFNNLQRYVEETSSESVELLAALKRTGGMIPRRSLSFVLEEGGSGFKMNSPISGEDAQYILFTSGSTGAPKGVMMPARSIDRIYKYFRCYLPKGDGLTFFNRVHFSFDVSVFDFAIALSLGHTLFALDDEAESNLGTSFRELHDADLALWVSTPSYLNMCLADPAFSETLLPSAQVFVVCGETLYNSTAAKFYERFPNAKLLNTYGPTETQAITDVLIDARMIDDPEPLPVGMPSPYTKLLIMRPDSMETLAPNEPGEVVILGETVASGYYGRPDLTEKVFGFLENPDGSVDRYYRTGDEGFLDKEGMLHFIGRFDTQIKINGYRIELGEIEETLNRIQEVSASCVVPVARNGVYHALAAHVVVDGETAGPRELTRKLKSTLRLTLPDYMIPRTFKYHNELPVNSNGKTDRKALEQAFALS